jgi:hypothetical protein
MSDVKIYKLFLSIAQVNNLHKYATTAYHTDVWAENFNILVSLAT